MAIHVHHWRTSGPQWIRGFSGSAKTDLAIGVETGAGSPAALPAVVCACAATFVKHKQKTTTDSFRIPIVTTPREAKWRAKETARGKAHAYPQVKLDRIDECLAAFPQTPESPRTN